MHLSPVAHLPDTDHQRVLQEKQEKTMPFGDNLMRSQAVYQIAQELFCNHMQRP